jgi:hypothetical protein
MKVTLAADAGVASRQDDLAPMKRAKSCTSQR